MDCAAMIPTASQASIRVLWYSARTRSRICLNWVSVISFSARNFRSCSFVLGGRAAASTFLSYLSARGISALLLEDTLYDTLHIHRVTERALRRVGAVFAVLELDDPAAGRTDRAVVRDLEVLQRIDHTALEVPALGCTDCSVDETFTATDCVEEELGRVEAAFVAVLDEPVGIRAPVTLLEVREGPVVITTDDTLTTDGLLADTTGHLGQVQHRTTGTGDCHHDTAVPETEVPACNLTGLVPGFPQHLHDLHLKGLLDRSPGHRFELAVLVDLDTACDIECCCIQHFI